MGAVKVINKATGEYIELEYASFEDGSAPSSVDT